MPRSFLLTNRRYKGGDFVSPLIPSNAVTEQDSTSPTSHSPTLHPKSRWTTRFESEVTSSTPRISSPTSPCRPVSPTEPMTSHSPEPSSNGHIATYHSGPINTPVTPYQRTSYYENGQMNTAVSSYLPITFDSGPIHTPVTSDILRQMTPYTYGPMNGSVSSDMSGSEDGDSDSGISMTTESGSDVTARESGQEYLGHASFLYFLMRQGALRAESDAAQHTYDRSPPSELSDVSTDDEKPAPSLMTSLDSVCLDPHVCPDCGKRYSTPSNLARHRQTHRSVNDQKARKCPHCDKIYVSSAAYSMHVRTHSQGCECTYCGKRFSRPWLLQGHLRTHTGERPFPCAQCGKAFADKSNLRAHVQTHSSAKPYVCGRCGKAFALKSYLYKHEESSCMRSHRFISSLPV